MSEIRHRYTGEIIARDDELTLNDLVSANKAHLGGAHLGGAHLEGADLEGADLGGAYLRGARLEDADLTGAHLGGAGLRGAHLRGAYLRGADLIGADLGGAHLEGATYGDGVPLTKEPIQTTGGPFYALILDEHAKLGCQMAPFDEWKKFDLNKARAIDEDITEDEFTLWYPLFLAAIKVREEKS